jgi:hypothetical protein
MPVHIQPPRSSAAIPPDSPCGVDRSRLDLHPGLRSGLRMGVHLDPDPETDPSQICQGRSRPLSASDALLRQTLCLGVSPGETTTIGDCL